MRLILASTSPRRKALLEKLGIAFDIVAPDYQEVITPSLKPEQQAVAFALGKAQSVGVPTAVGVPTSDAFILGSDTLVVYNSSGASSLILGKPKDVCDARRMLSLLRGRTHRVITGIALIIPRGTVVTWYEVTEVRMHNMSDAQIEWYLSTQEPFDKAGAYAIQEKGGRFIAQVCGNIDNVAGLPLQSVATALRRYGFAVPAFPN